MSRRIRVGILFGGRSAEHEVSLKSARNVIRALDQNRYEAVLIGIDRKGAWYLNEDSIALLQAEDSASITLSENDSPVSLIPSSETGRLITLADRQEISGIDVLFPVLHGPYGEDGSVQGLARLANLACVGSDILGSAIAMDKDVSKRLLHAAGIPVAPHRCLRAGELNDAVKAELAAEFRYPLYSKPANMGSSVGVVKVYDEAELEQAVNTGLRYDTKVVIEKNIDAREIECSVLGNENPVASVVGEIGTDDGFYSYEKKYVNDDAKLIIPAVLDASVETRVRDMAVRAFQVLECRGMARVDMFLTADNEILVNEINTIPGFTEISMYPKLWQASGLSYGDLIDRLIELALEDHNAKSRLSTIDY